MKLNSHPLLFMRRESALLVHRLFGGVKHATMLVAKAEYSLYRLRLAQDVFGKNRAP
jgi:hypothetical protein